MYCLETMGKKRRERCKRQTWDPWHGRKRGLASAAVLEHPPDGHSMEHQDLFGRRA